MIVILYLLHVGCCVLTWCVCFQGDKSGATAVVAFIRGEEIYIGWLGDSQAVLVREGKAVRLVDPHKPEREVSKWGKQ